MVITHKLTKEKALLKSILAACAVAVFVGGCAGFTVANVSAAKSQLELVCDNLSAVGTAIKSTPGAVTPEQQTLIDTKIAPAVTKVCTAKIPDQVDLKSLQADIAPLALKVIELSTLPVDQKTQLTFGVNLANAVLKQRLEASTAQ